MRDVVTGDPGSCSALAAALVHHAGRLGGDLRSRAVAVPLRESGEALQRYAVALAGAREAGRTALRFAFEHGLDVDSTGQVVEPWKPAPVEAVARRRGAMDEARALVEHAQALSRAATDGLLADLEGTRVQLDSLAERLEHRVD